MNAPAWRAGSLASHGWALRSKFIGATDDSVRYARRHFRLLGMAAIVSLTSYYFIWKLLYPDDYVSLTVRLFGSALCLPLVFIHRMPGWFDSYLKWYWLVTLTVVLPFVFGFELAQNATIAEFGEINIIWPLQNVIALVLFMMLINDGLVSTTLWLVTTAAIYALTQSGFDTSISPELMRVYVEPMPLYGFILVVGSLAIRNREIIDQEKLSAVAAVGSTIAHELRTPCMGIKALAEGIQSYLPTLIAGYDAAIANHLDIKQIRGRHIDALRNGLGRIQDETDYANRVIDMLLINSSEQPLRGLDFELISAADCVRLAIKRFPFPSEHERRRLNLDLESSFTISAPEVLLIHVLFNLVKNASYYVEKSGGGTITVRTDAAQRTITIEDNGTGIPPENLSRIFDRFFTTTDTGHGSGIGLAFCKMVMTGVGGSIACDSTVDEYTRFTLSFPDSSHG